MGIRTLDLRMFKPKDFLQDLCENEILRCVDAELVKRRCNEQRRNERFTVFVENVDPQATKVAFYEALSSLDGEKKVLSSAANR